MSRLDRTVLLALYRMMCRIRAFEDAAEEASRGGVAAFGQPAAGNARVRGPLHLSTGQEAVAAGVCAHLRPSDFLTSTHRGHGHTLAKGADMTRMMQELFGRAAGFCGGKGGSMHIADFSVGMLGANGVVAAGIPIAVGAAQSISVRGLDAVAVSFFGDGAINRGPFAESLNWAAAFRLPLLFVCEDNQWSATTKTSEMSAGAGAAERARAFGVAADEVNGMDAGAVWEAAGRLLGSIRSGNGPALLHARTYRYKGHVSVDPASYRDPRELEAARQHDALLLAQARLARFGVAAAEWQALEQAARDEVAQAVAAADAAAWPADDTAFTDVVTVGADRWQG
ncbi:MAG TPA: thiamine pyrophosphate-dependent dehydrogenase E1 component subunit alpha [Burkholderiaceae bacterium]|nr:thiamine pyrophosphate-dependent dehydrogenase E1 component subunit alpha [Burkholderiaceae bacterium]